MRMNAIPVAQTEEIETENRPLAKRQKKVRQCTQIS